MVLIIVFIQMLGWTKGVFVSQGCTSLQTAVDLIFAHSKPGDSFARLKAVACPVAFRFTPIPQAYFEPKCGISIQNDRFALCCLLLITSHLCRSSNQVTSNSFCQKIGLLGDQNAEDWFNQAVVWHITAGSWFWPHLFCIPKLPLLVVSSRPQKKLIQLNCQVKGP